MNTVNPTSILEQLQKGQLVSRNTVVLLALALQESRAELEEWRFTNRIDELPRENDRLRASQQGAEKLPQDERARLSDQQIGEIWHEAQSHGKNSYLSYAREIEKAALAQRAASVPAEAVQPHYMVVGKKGGWIDANKDLYDAAADWNRRILYAAPVPAASVQADEKGGAK